jgi:5-methylcytosine-specific restriction enzyme B
MDSAFDPLIKLIYSHDAENWAERNKEALSALLARYPKAAEKHLALRAPEMRDDDGVRFAAYIAPGNATSGAYSGMSFAIFPVADAPCLITMVVGTLGLDPDQSRLGRPGHARRCQAIAKWLNKTANPQQMVAWAKHDPTRTDTGIPDEIRREWSEYGRPLARYGNELYLLYRPQEDREACLRALKAFLDLYLEERGFQPLAAFQKDRIEIQRKWFSHLMPRTEPDDVVRLLKARRYVVLQGPPGTGKTRLADSILKHQYEGNGFTIQFHPSTTYENFVGGLAPATDANTLGFRFAPKPGFLMEAARKASEDPSRDYLLHIDEINRADLGKVLGEAIYLLEPEAESTRGLQLPFDFGQPFHQRFSLPPNLHILGTMNSSDRSIAILDVAVRRRFAFVSMWPDTDAVKQNSCELGVNAFEKLLSEFIEHAPEDALGLIPGHSYFLGKDKDALLEKLRTSLAPLLQEYLAQGYVTGFAEPIRAYLQWLESQQKA